MIKIDFFSQDKANIVNSFLAPFLFAFLISLVMFLPAVYFIFFVSPVEPITSSEIVKGVPIILGYILKLAVAIFIVLFLVSARARNSLKDFKKPIVITVTYFVNTFFIVSNNFSGFTPGDKSVFIKLAPILFASWLLLPVVYSEFFKKLKPLWLIKTVQFLILCPVLYSGLIFIIIDGSFLLVRVITF